MQWEYVTIKFSTISSWGNLHLDEKSLNQTLNYQGWEGWELVSTSELCGPAGGTQELALIFKRPVSAASSNPAK